MHHRENTLAAQVCGAWILAVFLVIGAFACFPYVHHALSCAMCLLGGFSMGIAFERATLYDVIKGNQPELEHATRYNHLRAIGVYEMKPFKPNKETFNE